ATENTDTYYIYNEYNQLAFVIPPKAVRDLENQGFADGEEMYSDVLSHLCYEYRYDSRNRLVEKKLPGKGSEYMVYDKADRLIMTQDANLRQQGKWLITKYDQFGRVAYTGMMGGDTRVNMQNQAGNLVIVESRNGTGFTKNGMQLYYTNNYFFTMETVLSVNYYDTYPTGTPAIPTQILGQSILSQDAQNSNMSTKSLPTASYVKNIEDDNWTKNYTWYDQKGRAIGSHSINHLGGYTKTESELDFSGTPKMAITKHKRLDSDAERIITENFTYDHQNRLLTHTHQVDNNPVEYLVQNKYNELSQLEYKKVGGTGLGQGLQQVDYLYNIRGWMTQINNPTNLGSDLFGYKIKYNQVEGEQTPNNDFSTLQVKPKYNGNIAEIDWKTSTQENEPLKRYGYVYDGLNRLLAGFYQKDSNPTAKEYFEKIDYDLNGNIMRLQRSAELMTGNTAAFKIDNLKYDYLGNRLTKVTEEQIGGSNGYPYLASHNTIEYDNNLANGNGNMTKHLDKGISSIQYNFLNLPKQITQNAQVTNYIYRADGVKVKKLFGDIETNYLDGFQYKTESENGGGGIGVIDPNEVAVMKLSIIPTSEGYFDALSNQYIYNYTDHLGNVRLSYSDTNKDGIVQPRRYFWQQCDGPWDPFNPPNCIDGWRPGEIVEVNNYYPFGLLHNYTATTQNAYQYKYNGKELQETGMYDYGARFYMPDIGRWGVMDPLAEKNRRFNPYNYAINNPIRFIDPDGRSESDWVKRTGQSSWEYNSTITSAQQASDAGYVAYADGRGDANSTYITPMSSNGVDTGVDREIVLGEGGNYTVDGKAFIAEDQAPYVSSKEVDKLAKFLGAQPYIPAFIMSGGTGSRVMDYLTGAATRGVTDLSTQTLFKGSENVDGRQLLINTVVGGGSGFQSVGKTALTNLSLNTANNFGTSYINGTGSQDAAINTVKIFTGALGNAAGVIGGNPFTNTVLPSLYMNGTDKMLNNANEKYQTNRFWFRYRNGVYSLFWKR
ncbi:RHS repeat-associated core domain-containing protein, partial [Chryseobacterium sp. 8AT]|uniref:RHS repeat-associated core domain-containing protein n=1 Tax=Chryseobacterium sp. 8AT TaxID=2653134 RepID=UPI001628D9D5